jgi:hypothetical protein
MFGIGPTELVIFLFLAALFLSQIRLPALAYIRLRPQPRVPARNIALALALAALIGLIAMAIFGLATPAH